MLNDYLLWITSTLLIVVILVRAFQNSSLGRYRLFYSYLVYTLLISVARFCTLFWYDPASRFYHHLYHLTSLFMQLLQLGILWDIYRQIVGNSKSPWRNRVLSGIVFSVLTAIVGWQVFRLQGDPYYRSEAVLLFAQMVILVIVYRGVAVGRKVELSRSLKGILFGMSLLIGLQAMNFAGFFFNNGSFQSFAFYIQFVYFVALAVFAYTLWSPDTEVESVTVVPPSHSLRLEKAGEDLRKVVRTLVQPR